MIGKHVQLHTHGLGACLEFLDQAGGDLVHGRSMQALYHPAFGRTLNAQENYVPDDPDGQVGGTIDLMRKYVAEDAGSEAIRKDVAEAVGALEYNHIPQRELIQRVFNYVKRRISFVDDSRLSSGIGLDGPGSIPIIEVLIRPRDMAEMCGDGHQCQRMGDCDDFSMYTAALLTALGIRTSFVTIAADKSDPDRFSHVYVAAYTNDGERIPVDVSHGPHPGWEHGYRTRIEEWPIGGGSLELIALGLLLYYVAGRM